MSKNVSTTRIKTAILMFFTAVTLALILVFPFFAVFGPLTHFRLPPNSAAWANFGNYAAGVVGPLFTLCAFVGVLLTVLNQAEQLDLYRGQAQTEEMQRLISSVSTSTDALLAQEIDPNRGNNIIWSGPRVVFTLISIGGTAALTESEDYIEQTKAEGHLQAMKSLLQETASGLAIELDQLSWCLIEYERQNGNKSVLSFYKRRYSATVCWLDAMGFVSSCMYLQKFFEPEKSRNDLRPKAAGGGH